MAKRDTVAAARPRQPLIPGTKGRRGRAATLQRAPAMGFFEDARSGVVVYVGSVVSPSTLYPLPSVT
eukprot:COSAG02_NODE_38466_length_428_cov_1.750760_1_plen_67_part_00